MARFTRGFCLVLTLAFVGCNAAKDEKGPTTEAVKQASQEDINKSMKESFQKMKEANDKAGGTRAVPDAPADVKGAESK